MNIGKNRNLPPKVVIDSNIYISAYVFGGLPSEILEYAQTNSIVLFVSPSIINEVSRVLNRKFLWSQGQLNNLIDNILQFAFLNYPNESVTAAEDKSDNRILECALEAKADFIISGDRHLLKLKRFSGMPILTIRQFLNIYNRSSKPR